MKTRKHKKTFAVVQYDNRPLSDELKQLMAINKRYCKLHGYDYFFIHKEYPMPPYWIKIFLVQKLLPSYTGVLWLDTDAVIHSKSSLTSICKPNKSMYICKNRPSWGNINAGVWLLLNTESGNQIIQDWVNSYNPKRWTFSKKWTTKGVWAGPDYEQGAFNITIFPKHKKEVYVYPWHFFQSYKPTTKDVFIYHFAHDTRVGNMTPIENYLTFLN